MLKAIGALALTGLVGGLITASERRAAYWRPVVEAVALKAGDRVIGRITVLPLKGCGWSVGETVYARLSLGGIPTDFEMCRNRHGVRVDLTTYESRWIRGAKAGGQ